MSEYQYYEFQTLDRRLTEREMQSLRSLSTRATITPTSFTNVYEWGDFRGSPAKLMEEFFDAFLYLANWGSRQVSFRFHEKAVDLKTLKYYCRGQGAKVRKKGESIILDLTSEDEEGDFDDDGEGRLPTFAALRDDIAAGDMRALYLCWLMTISAGEADDDEEEPPCPAGLRDLLERHESFMEFMRIDADLLAVAATNSPDANAESGPAAMANWVAGLAAAEKDAFITEVLKGDDAAGVRASLLRRFRSAVATTKAKAPRARKVAELRAAAAAHAEVRERAEREAAARRSAQQKRKTEANRARRLAELAPREAEAWRTVDDLIAKKEPASYREAVKILLDLRDLATAGGRAAEVVTKVLDLHRAHVSKRSFLMHLTDAGLGTKSLKSDRKA